MMLAVRMGLLVALCAASTLVASNAWAHGSALGTLKIEQLDELGYAVLWKRNRAALLAEGVEIQWPAHCQTQGRIDTTFLEAATLERMRLSCTEPGLEGGTIALPPAPSGLHALIEVRWLDGTVAHRLVRDERQIVVARNAGAETGDVFLRYSGLGIEHILLGIDHLLFVLGLLFLVTTLRRLAWVVTAFTLAHSLTLALAVLEIVELASAPVEACIALSIVLLAREALTEGETVTRRAPWLVGFAFGLLHGLGFAGALTEVGLPSDQLPLALLSFNVGVEVGQLMFVVMVWGALRWCATHRPRFERQLRTALCYGMGGIAVMWTIERTLSIGG